MKGDKGERITLRPPSFLLLFQRRSTGTGTRLEERVEVNALNANSYDQETWCRQQIQTRSKGEIYCPKTNSNSDLMSAMRKKGVKECIDRACVYHFIHPLVQRKPQTADNGEGIKYNEACASAPLSF